MAANNPTITFVCLSYNDEDIIQKTIDSIRSQAYDQTKVKILFLDGGSVDKTITIIKKNNCDFYSRPDLKDCPYLRIELGSRSVTTDYAVFWSCDCSFTNPNTLMHSVTLLDKNRDAVAAWSSRYSYSNDDNYLTKYLATIGAVDPVAYGLKKSERIPFDKQGWHSYGKVTIDNESYIQLKLEPDSSKFPAAGANYFIVKTWALREAKAMLNGLHVEFCIRLSKLNYSFLVIKNIDIIHKIEGTINQYLRRKISWADLYSKDNNIDRGYYVFGRADTLRLVIFILSNILILPQLFIATHRFIKTRSAIWFYGIYINNLAISYYSIFYAKKIIKRALHSINT